VSASQLDTPRVFSPIIYLSFLGPAMHKLVVWVQRTLVFRNEQDTSGGVA